MTKLPEDYKEMLSSMVEDLDGSINFYDTYSHNGRQSKKIVIEYDIINKNDV